MTYNQQNQQTGNQTNIGGNAHVGADFVVRDKHEHHHHYPAAPKNAPEIPPPFLKLPAPSAALQCRVGDPRSPTHGSTACCATATAGGCSAGRFTARTRTPPPPTAASSSRFFGKEFPTCSNPLRPLRLLRLCVQFLLDRRVLLCSAAGSRHGRGGEKGCDEKGAVYVGSFWNPRLLIDSRL